jgi:CMP-N,N'-diacetyllegionaminic acid synthase|tara:strand:+ start:1806 stop:2528 length:723 start_codon:yes stop_codon:yes gene_type:complete
LKVLGIIPARGNSKGLPKKNILKLNNEPLIRHSITSAKKSTFLDKIIVSTDNLQIAKIAKDSGIDVPFIRPKILSQDSTEILDVIKHAINFLDKNNNFMPDIVVLLQPTSPFRTTEMIDNAIKILKTTLSSSVVSVSLVKDHPDISFWHNQKYLKPFNSDFTKFSNRQTQKPLYSPTGGIYAFRTENLIKYNSIYGPKIKPMFIDDKFINLDIDELYDLFICEMTIKHWKNYKHSFKKSQ